MKRHAVLSKKLNLCQTNHIQKKQKNVKLRDQCDITICLALVNQTAENPKISTVPSFTPGVNQNTASHVSPTATKSAFLISAFPVHSTSFFPPNPLETQSGAYQNSVSHLYL